MTKRKYEDLFKPSDIIIGECGIPCLSMHTIENKLWDEFKQFREWMTGQSMISEGVFLCDLKNYFHKRDTWKLNWLPHWY